MSIFSNIIRFSNCNLVSKLIPCALLANVKPYLSSNLKTLEINSSYIISSDLMFSDFLV